MTKGVHPKKLTPSGVCPICVGGSWEPSHSGRGVRWQRLMEVPELREWYRTLLLLIDGELTRFVPLKAYKDPNPHHWRVCEKRVRTELKTDAYAAVLHYGAGMPLTWIGYSIYRRSKNDSKQSVSKYAGQHIDKFLHKFKLDRGSFPLQEVWSPCSGHQAEYFARFHGVQSSLRSANRKWNPRQGRRRSKTVSLGSRPVPGSALGVEQGPVSAREALERLVKYGYEISELEEAIAELKRAAPRAEGADPSD